MSYAYGLKAFLAGGSLLALSSCLAAPGEFNADLVLLSDGSYQFSYDGEITLLTLATIMDEINEDFDESFDPYCMEQVETDDGFEMTERDCTKAEIAEQRAEYEERMEQKRANEEEKSAQIRAALGGIDPSDPSTIDDFAERLERQAGWESVEHKGNALFEVSYRTSGTLPDNFGFPLIADAPTGQPFITIARWDNGGVKVDAPMFISGSSNSFWSAAFMSGFMGEAEKEGLKMPEPNGTFTIRTDGEILTNNTDTGPATQNGLKLLSWDVGKLDRPPPQALIGF